MPRSRLLPPYRTFELVALLASLACVAVRSQSVTLDVSIESPTQEQMDQVTSSIDLQNLPQEYTVEQIPQSLIEANDAAFEPVNTFMSGFQVSSVVYSDVDYAWKITARYVPNVPNTVTAMYLSKVGSAPYSSAVKNTFYVSEHPCMQTFSVCCLNSFKDSYYVGTFRENITKTIGVCGEDVQTRHTEGMFDTSFASDQHLVNNVFADFPDSRVVRQGAGLVDLYISETDVRYNMSMKETVNTGATLGSRLTFFVGMSYFTLLPANAISTVTSQTKISITMTSSLTISFATEQDYTFVKYVTMNVFQNKWLENPMVERQMQYVRMGLVLPSDIQQNMRTGLIPLGSIRFAVATILPDMNDQTQWTNPCYSKQQDGMWDSHQGWRNLYAGASSQECATQPNMCVNPLSYIMASNLVDFNFPIGDGTIHAAHYSGTDVYYLFVYFDISILDNVGRAISTKVFVKAPITSLSIAKSCESVQVDFSLLSTTNVNLNLGLVGSESEWSKGVLKYDGLEEGFLDTTVETKARSLQAGLITLIVQGDPRIFSSQLTAGYYLEIEHMTVLHFLDTQKFVGVNRMISEKTGYAVEKDEVSGVMRIRMTKDVLDQCNDGGVSCVVQHAIVNDIVQDRSSVYPFATGFQKSNSTAARGWLTTNLIGVSEFGNELADNMTSLVVEKYAIDNRVNKAFYVNPGYKWVMPNGSPSQSVLQLSDKLILLAIIVLKDSQGMSVRRRLMSASFDGASEQGRRLLQIQDGQVVLKPTDEIMQSNLEALKQSSRSVRMPAISNEINVGTTVAMMAGSTEEWNGLNISLYAKFPSMWSLQQVHLEISNRLRLNLAQYCDVCTSATPVFFNLQPQGSLVDALTLYAGSVSVWMTKREAVNKIELMKLFQSLIEEKYSAALSTCRPSSNDANKCVTKMQPGQVLLESAVPIWLDNAGETIAEWPDFTQPVLVTSYAGSMQVPPSVFGDNVQGIINIEFDTVNSSQPEAVIVSSLVVVACQDVPVKPIPVEVNVEDALAGGTRRRMLLQAAEGRGDVKLFVYDPSAAKWNLLSQQTPYQGGLVISGVIQPTDFRNTGTRNQALLYALQTTGATPVPEQTGSGLGAGAIAGIVIAALVVVVIGLAIFWSCDLRRSRSLPESTVRVGAPAPHAMLFQNVGFQRGSYQPVSTLA